MSHGSDSHMGFLGAPRRRPYCLAPVMTMTHFREEMLPVNLRALKKLSSMAPRECGQCVERVRWGAGIGKEVKGDATVHFSVFFLRVFLEVGSEEDVFGFHILEVFGHLFSGRGQVDIVMDDVGRAVFLLAAGEGMHGRLFLRIAAEFKDDFAAKDACV